MRKLLIALVSVIIFAACSKDNGSNECPYKDDPITVPDAQIVQIVNYLDSTGLSAIQHPNGFFYNITTQGSGETPTVCHTIEVKYVGKRASNDSIFDNTGNTSRVLSLGQLIPGWRKGLPLISTGGKIRLYLPPALGYGDRDVLGSGGQVVIPKNSMIIFDVELVAAAPL